MPQKKRPPKCIYCRHSKLTDKCFEVVLAAFLSGISAEKTRGVLEDLKDEIDMRVPSEKTIRRHFGLIGDRLFEDFAEPWILEKHPPAAELKRLYPSTYDETLQSILLDAHERFLSGDIEMAQKLNECLMTYRSLSANKFGIRNSIKENFGLAFYRQMIVDSCKGKITQAFGVKKFNAQIGLSFVIAGGEMLMRRFRERPL